MPIHLTTTTTALFTLIFLILHETRACGNWEGQLTEECYDDLGWARGVGAEEHPEYYPWFSEMTGSDLSSATDSDIITYWVCTRMNEISQGNCPGLVLPCNREGTSCDELNPISWLRCPERSRQVGLFNSDIAGCGLEACDDRYNHQTIGDCLWACANTYKNICKSFTYAPDSGDSHHPGRTVCTLYDTEFATRVGGPIQVMCKPFIDLECPHGSEQIGGLNAEILGCGLEECDARFEDSYADSAECMNACQANADCKSFTWASVGGDLWNPGHSVCTLYDTDIDSNLILNSNSNQIMCKPGNLLCADGYFLQSDGDIPGYGEIGNDGGRQSVDSCQECADLCTSHFSCFSYECMYEWTGKTSNENFQCNLNTESNPSENGAFSQYFCTKDTESLCADGYFLRKDGDNNIIGWGTVEDDNGIVAGNQYVDNCGQCAILCSDRSKCHSYECVTVEGETGLKCNLNVDADPTTTWPVQYFCTKSEYQTIAPLQCPYSSEQIGSINADILGCGLEGCSARYDDSYANSAACMDGCTANANCKSFTWAPAGGDSTKMDTSVCTLYDSDIVSNTAGPKQIMCEPACDSGYFYQKHGDVAGYGSVGGYGDNQAVDSCRECAALCSGQSQCHSYECYDDNGYKCNLNYEANPSVTSAYYEQYFCTKLEADVATYTPSSNYGSYECNYPGSFVQNYPVPDPSCYNHHLDINMDCTRYHNWDCYRDNCRLSEINFDASTCSAANTEIRERGDSIEAQMMDVTWRLTSALLGSVPIIGPGMSTAMSFAKGLFGMLDDSDSTEDKLRADINQRFDDMHACMAEELSLLNAQNKVNEIQEALLKYDQAKVDQNDKFDKLQKAWDTHLEKATVYFDDTDENHIYFKYLQIPVQGFTQTFLLCATDYLIYLVKNEENRMNYNGDFEFTMDGFETLKQWAIAGRDVIMTDMIWKAEHRPDDQPPFDCRNVDSLRAEMTEVSEAYYVANIRPIERAIDQLNTLNEILTGELACDQYPEPLRCGVSLNTNAMPLVMLSAPMVSMLGVSSPVIGNSATTTPELTSLPTSAPIDASFDSTATVSELSVVTKDARARRDRNANGDNVLRKGDVCKSGGIETGKPLINVLSIDHKTGKDGEYFNFDAKQMDKILGKKWKFGNFLIFNPRTDEEQSVRMWRTMNGGSIGTAHGRKEQFASKASTDWQIGDELEFIYFECGVGLDCLPKKNMVAIGGEVPFICQ